MQKKKAAANLLMLVGTMIWGGAFVAQSIGAAYVGPYTFGAVRFSLGSLVILPVMLLTRKLRPRPAEHRDAPLRDYVIAGLTCGGSLFFGALFQQMGIEQTTVGKAGFVTALYVVLVPLFCWILYRRRIHINTFAALVLAVIGTFLLCVTEQMTVSKGDILVFIGTIFWAVQILCIEKFAQHLDGLKFALWEFLTCAVINAVLMFAVEKPTLGQFAAAWPVLLYAGVLSVGVGFTAQIVCLKYTDPTVASLIMSLESVFSVIFGFLILHETLTLRQGFGCLLVFSAVVLAQLLPKGTKPVLPDEESPA